jgi:hypothetical protein
VTSPAEGAGLSDAARADSFARLVLAIRAELQALDAEDADAIEQATRAKTEALSAVQGEVAAGRMDRPALEEARRLNSEAALKARAKMIGVERKLMGVARAAGRPDALTYGRDGRWARTG